MDSFQDHHKTPGHFLDKSLFSPFLFKTLKVQEGSGFKGEPACYNSKYNMIIACSGQSIQFYDATTFEPLKEMEVLGLKSPVVQMTFHPETDIYLLGCTEGVIYKYNVSKHKLKELNKWPYQVIEIMFLNSSFYAFSLLSSTCLYIGNLNDKASVLKFELGNNASHGLCHLSKEKLLFAGSDNGSVRIYRTNKLPHLKAICSVKAGEEWIFTIQCINVNGKEYMIRGGETSPMKIWHFLKGKMRLLKVLQEEDVSSLVYLENYKMIAATCESKEIKFWRFPSMKLERTINFSEDTRDLFLVKEKNLIGRTNLGEYKIEFVKLHDGYLEEI